MGTMSALRPSWLAHCSVRQAGRKQPRTDLSLGGRSSGGRLLGLGFLLKRARPGSACDPPTLSGLACACDSPSRHRRNAGEERGWTASACCTYCGRQQTALTGAAGMTVDVVRKQGNGAAVSSPGSPPVPPPRRGSDRGRGEISRVVANIEGGERKPPRMTNNAANSGATGASTLLLSAHSIASGWNRALLLDPIY